MIEDVDASLRAAVEPSLTGGVEVTFDPPASEDAAPAPNDARLSVFLLRVTEDPAGLGTGFVEVRDERGRVVRRERPPRRYRLDYLVSVAAASVAEEHRLLGRVMTVLGDLQVLSADHLRGELTGDRASVTVRVAGEDSVANALEVWGAFGVRPRGCFGLVVCVTLRPASAMEPATRVEHIVLNAGSAPGPSGPGEPLEQRTSAPAGTGEPKPRREGRVRHVPRRG